MKRKKIIYISLTSKNPEIPENQEISYIYADFINIEIDYDREIPLHNTCFVMTYYLRSFDSKNFTKWVRRVKFLNLYPCTHRPLYLSLV